MLDAKKKSVSNLSMYHYHFPVLHMGDMALPIIQHNDFFFNFLDKIQFYNGTF